MALGDSGLSRIRITATQIQTALGGTVVLNDNTATLTGKTISSGIYSGSVINSGLRVVTAAGAVTVSATDHIIIVNKTSGAATTVDLPASPATGRTLVIKDGKGDANVNNITIDPNAAGTIDGAATLVLSGAYDAAKIVYTGSEWSVI